MKEKEKEKRKEKEKDGKMERGKRNKKKTFTNLKYCLLRDSFFPQRIHFGSIIYENAIIEKRSAFQVKKVVRNV